LLYYKRLEKEQFKWSTNNTGILNISFEELKWLVNGQKLRLEERKFKEIKSIYFY